MTVFTNSPQGQKAIANIRDREKAQVGSPSSTPKAKPKYQKLTQDDAKAMIKELHQDEISVEDWNVMLGHTGAGYFGTSNSFKINEALREGYGLDGENRRTVEALDKNMKPSTRDLELTRMIDSENFFKNMGVTAEDDFFDPFEAVSEKDLKSLVGKVYEDKGYQSTSFEMEGNVFKYREITMNVKVPKGTNILMGPLTSSPKGKIIDEAEILLARGTAMKITRVESLGKGPTGVQKYMIDAEIIVD